MVRLLLLATLTSMAAPALAQQSEVTLDATVIRGTAGYAREFRPDRLIGGEIGIGFPYIGWTLTPPRGGIEKKFDFGELLHVGIFYRHRTRPGFEVGTGLSASFAGLWPCRVSDCWPSLFDGAYVARVTLR